MKVGISSCYSHHNYGSMLQAYATQKVVEELGAEAITIGSYKPIHYMTQSKFRYYFHKITNKDILFGKIRTVSSRIEEKKYKDVVDGRKIRDEYFNDFCKDHFKLSPMNENRDELSAFSSSCDVVLVGSDQLWNPINVEHDFFTLTWVPDNVRKVSYATSIGATVIPDYEKQQYIEFLNRFADISVRESSAAETLKEIGVKKKVEVVLDPTLLMTGEEWMSIQQKEPLVREKYILCYFLGTNREHRRFAEKVRELTGYKIIALEHLDEFVKDDLTYADKAYYEAGPAEFVNLVRNAEYVCTDSFHGSCFSILNHKRFFTFNRYKSNNTQSTNSRIDSLFENLGITGRRVSGPATDDEIKKLLELNINYDEVDIRLEEKRKASKEYLRRAIWG